MNGALDVSVFPRGGTLYLVVVPSDPSQNSLLYEWSDNKFRMFHEVPDTGITQVKALTSESDIYLIFAKGIHIYKICLMEVH